MRVENSPERAHELDNGLQVRRAGIERLGRSRSGRGRGRGCWRPLAGSQLLSLGCGLPIGLLKWSVKHGPTREHQDDQSHIGIVRKGPLDAMRRRCTKRSP
jgi:hypothetical protein